MNITVSPVITRVSLTRIGYDLTTGWMQLVSRAISLHVLAVTRFQQVARWC